MMEVHSTLQDHLNIPQLVLNTPQLRLCIHQAHHSIRRLINTVLLEAIIRQQVLDIHQKCQFIHQAIRTIPQQARRTHLLQETTPQPVRYIHQVCHPQDIVQQVLLIHRA